MGWCLFIEVRRISDDVQSRLQGIEPIIPAAHYGLWDEERCVPRAKPGGNA